MVWCLLIARSHDATADSSARHTLSWTRAPGAEGCIDADALAAAVDARLGRTAFKVADERTIRIEAHVRPFERGWHVAISVRAPDGESLGQRELEERGADCRVLDDVLVLVLALIIDPDAAMREPAPPPPIPPPIPPPPPPAPKPPEPTRPPEVPWAFGASGSVIAAGALLPGAAVGGALRFELDPPGLPRLAVRGSVWWEDERRAGAQGARFGLVTTGLSACPALGLLEICGGLEVGRMAAEGFGFDRSQQSASAVLYVVVEPQLRVPLATRLALIASIGTWIPLVRPRFVFDQAGQAVLLHQPSPAALVGHVGLALRF